MAATKKITNIATITNDGLIKIVATYELPPQLAITVFKNERTNWSRWSYGNDDPHVILLPSGRYAYNEEATEQVFFTVEK